MVMVPMNLIGIGVFIKWSKTGPDRRPGQAGPDRTGPRPFGSVLGPVLFCFRSSVRSGFGPGGLANGPDRTGHSSLTLYSLPLHLAVFSCYCSPLNTPNSSNSLCSLVCANTGRRPVASGTAFQLVEPGENFKLIKMQMSGVGPVRFIPGSDRSGPVQDRLQIGPVLGPRSAKFSVLSPASPVQSNLVLER
ncbi:hypothetical protein Cgig2_008776 [Carnegiea gigantea]|uniref:Uncharacterized protein n=1 Tax=Carnegiea gigantea TaxID=171969 RepID=A0A9Q1JR82_9CARY|nr:hypothetical protein Cgig2_008776 [Carnegiea gigantea]